MTEHVKQEEIKISGDQLLAKVKELIHQGNIRRIVIKQDGRSIIELPLNLAIVGAVILPTLAAVGAVAALVTECSIVVERIVDDDDVDEPVEAETVTEEPFT